MTNATAPGYCFKDYSGHFLRLSVLCKETFVHYEYRWTLGTHFPPLGSPVRVSMSPRGFRGERNFVWVDISRSFSRFPLPRISFHHFFTLNSFSAFHSISFATCDGESVVVGRLPCYSQMFNKGASSHFILPDPVSDTWWSSSWSLSSSVLPKDRSSTANYGTKAAVLPNGRSSTTNSGTRLQFY